MGPSFGEPNKRAADRLIVRLIIQAEGVLEEFIHLAELARVLSSAASKQAIGQEFALSEGSRMEVMRSLI